MEKCRTQKQIEQYQTNEKILGLLSEYRTDYIYAQDTVNTDKLFNCSASIIYGDCGIWLRSYRTVIGFIPYNEKTCYDFLRYVYGYTATSAQHIRKFMQKFNIERKVTYY